MSQKQAINNYTKNKRKSVKVSVTELSTLTTDVEKVGNYKTAILEVSNEADEKLHLIDFSVVLRKAIVALGIQSFNEILERLEPSDAYLEDLGRECVERLDVEISIVQEMPNSEIHLLLDGVASNTKTFTRAKRNKAAARTMNCSLNIVLQRMSFFFDNLIHSLLIR